MNYSALNNWLNQLAMSLDENQRRDLMRKIAMGLKKRTAQRIKNQTDANGFRFIRRKRDQIGNKKRTGALFQRIHRQIKTDFNGNKASFGFAGRTGNIALIHQEGRVDKPTRHARPTRYPMRELVGFTDDDVAWIEQQIHDYMSDLA